MRNEELVKPEKKESKKEIQETESVEKYFLEGERIKKQKLTLTLFKTPKSVLLLRNKNSK